MESERPPEAGRVAAAALGVAAVGLMLGVGQLIAAAGQRLGVVGPGSSPVTSLGNRFIVISPEWLNAWAIRSFGVHDKQVLLVGMFATFAALAITVGLLARRRWWWAITLISGLVGVTLLAVWVSPGTGAPDGIPTFVGSILGVGFLWMARRSSSVGPHQPRRRTLLRFALLGGAFGALSGTLSRFIPTTRDVEDSRARIRIATPVSPGPSASGTEVSASGASTPPKASTPGSSTEAASPRVSDSPSASTPTPSPPPTRTAPTPPALTPTTTTTLVTEPFSAIDGLAPFITANGDFYRIDTTLSPPLLTAEAWSLRIHGRVANELRLNYEQLRARPQIERTITLGCVSNFVGGHLIGNANWTGARLDDLLDEAGPLLGADCVLSTSVDGFTCSTPLGALTDGRDALLAVGMNGVPLPIEHGFPVRMIVPGLYGYASATKWVIDLEVTSFQDVSAYWTSRGYARLGPVKTSSRIDVPAPYTQFGPGDAVTIAGVAWAQNRGIAAVQVQIDDGPWTTAELDAVPSKDTWRRWRYRWIATVGAHTVTCRAIDQTGAVQDPRPHDPLPDGATGDAGVRIVVS